MSELIQPTLDMPVITVTDIPNGSHDASWWLRLVQSRTGKAVGGSLAALSVLSACTAGEGNDDAPAATASAIGETPLKDRLAASVYYQPRLSDLHDPASLEVPASANYTMVAEPGQPDSWTIAPSPERSCVPDNADNFLDDEKTKNAHLLVGFSLGRLGVSYFLQTATPEQRDGIDSIVLVAPGNQEDFTDSCDPANASSLLSSWLQMSEDKALVILADDRSAEADFGGIRQQYLDGLAPGVSDQVSVCVTGQGHEEAWNENKGSLFGKPVIQACPADYAIYDKWRP